MKKINYKLPDMNSFNNNLAQEIEIINHREKAQEILDTLEIKKEKKKEPTRNSGHGIAANEAPRGTLWHEYKVKNKKT